MEWIKQPPEHGIYWYTETAGPDTEILIAHVTIFPPDYDTDEPDPYCMWRISGRKGIYTNFPALYTNHPELKEMGLDRAIYKPDAAFSGPIDPQDAFVVP